jgi:hypothetical protein
VAEDFRAGDSSVSNAASLVSLYRAQFEEAKKRSAPARYLRIALLVGTLVALTTPQWASYLIAVVALIVQLATIWMRIQSTHLRAVAEAGKRLNVLQDALGVKADQLSEVRIRERFAAAADRNAQKYDDKEHYFSKAPIMDPKN